MKKIGLSVICFLFYMAGPVQAFFPSHVQVCTADAEGQGHSKEMMINYEETDDGEMSCTVVYYYGFEYGSETGYRGMFQVYPLSITDLECTVEADDGDDEKLYIEVSREDEGGEIETLVENCLMTEGGDTENKNR